MPDEGRALVRGVNMVRRHQRQTASQEGGVISKEATIDLSNIAIADPKDGKPTRVGFKVLDDGRKVRFAKRSGDRDRWLRLPKPIPPRLKAHYDDVVRPAAHRAVRLQERHGSADPRQDRAEHGRRRSDGDTKKVTVAAADLALIAGQKPVITQARMAISQFKVRENMPIGAKVTLRKTAHVRVLRPPCHDRAAARPRFPRPQPEELRRPWQLCARDQGAHRSSPRSTTTRSTRSGAWTSSSAPRPRPTTKRARFSS